MTREAPATTAAPRLPLPGAEDTIAALATPAGRSALAVLRLSGPRARAVAQRLIHPWRETPRTAYLATLRDPETGALIDRPVVTLFAAPRSYTGEDVVELSLHGGHLAPALALAAALAAGAREALPGEFTRRAVANGKMDILQAEAIGDLIDAQSRAMHQAALAQMDGGLSRRITALRDALLHLEALIAYDIDFPEEDEGPVSAERVSRSIGDVVESLEALLASAHTGEVVRRGAVVVIAGAPNAGKSSLFNALVGATRAIVTEIPGTTRDAIEAVIDVGAWPVRLVDTAGLRETTDVVERLGIAVTARYLEEADVVLACGEDAPALAATVAEARTRTQAPVLAVRTKADLVAQGDYKALVGDGPSSALDGARVLPVSAVAHTGLAALTEALAALLTARHGGRRADVPLLTRERHRVAVQRARDEVALFAQAWADRALPPPVAAVHLHEATAALESLIGAVDVEDVLARVFSTFCVGK
jgi:tRNA modification GTPase